VATGATTETRPESRAEPLQGALAELLAVPGELAPGEHGNRRDGQSVAKMKTG